MKRNIIIVLIVLVPAVSLGGAYGIDRYRMKNNQPVFFSTWGYQYTPPEDGYVSVMCSAKSFQPIFDGAYLEIILDDEKHTVKKLLVKDETLFLQLSEADLGEIIGVNLRANLPPDLWEEKFPNGQDYLTQVLTAYEEYDSCFEVVGVSYRDGE